MAVKWVDRVPTRANRVLVTPEDGSTPYYATITRADEPSVVGTPVNAANLNAMQDAAGLTTHKTVYVATTGSDTTGTGTQAAPFATINKALASIPKNLNGYSATINVAAGTYPEKVSITNFGNGTLKITGTVGETATISGLFVANVRYLEISSLALNLTNSYLEASCSNVCVYSPFSVNGGTNGVYASVASNVLFFSTVTISNTTSYGVVSTSASKVYIATLAGTGNRMNVACTLGGVCVLGVDSSTTSGTQYFTDTGGRILAGSQTQIPNY